MGSQVPQQFLEAVTAALGAEAACDAAQGLASGCSEAAAVRVNPDKAASATLDPARFFPGSHPVAWSPWGYSLDERPVFTLDPLLHAGAYYVQDSSAMYVGAALRAVLQRDFLLERARKRPLRVLDLCAAPGGKSTDAAASLRERFGDRFLLLSNEVDRRRAGLLLDNTLLWGDPSLAVSSCEPRRIGQNLDGWFDIILADVPCSGEGMMLRDAHALEQGSEKLIRLCRKRQENILEDIWPALGDGGVLIYSTCTFNRSENDGVLDWAAEMLDGAVRRPEWLPDGGVEMGAGRVFIPGLVRGGGQFCGILQKGEDTKLKDGGDDRPPRAGNGDKARKAGGDGRSPGTGHDGRKPSGTEESFYLPEPVEKDFVRLSATLPLLRRGISSGVRKGGDFIPSHALALSLNCPRNQYPQRELDRETALRYLHRDSLSPDEGPAGLRLLTYQGLPLGFARQVDGRVNSLLPPTFRIRMNLPL